MDKAIKGKWIAALRSGKYPQGQGALNRNGSFCCLGVLCDVVEPESWQPRDGGYDGLEPPDVDPNAFLPKRIYEAVDLPKASQFELARMNDMGLSFKKIAKHIEESL